MAALTERPFPWRCHHCGKDDVVLTTTSYEAELKHEGRLCTFTIPNLSIPACKACSEKVFTEKVDDKINAAFRDYLHLLSPEDIRAALQRIDMHPKDAANYLGISEEMLSRWMNDLQIQSRAMDRLLRVLFAFPQVRAVLSGENQDPHLGTSDLMDQIPSTCH